MSPVTRCLVRPDTYRDSVVLMRVAAELEQMPGVVRAALMMATPANRGLLAEAGLLDGDAVAAGPGDLVIAVTAADARVAGDALASAARLLDQTAAAAPASAAGTFTAPRTIAEAAALGGANLAMISTPGAYATAEALKALKRGLSVFLFSDNVPIEDEIELKRLAAGKRLLMMGPDCGTAIVDGIPLGFANAVRRGRVGLAGASGTGLQQVSCLVDRLGEGLSQVIGVGSRDLDERVGGAHDARGDRAARRGSGHGGHRARVQAAGGRGRAGRAGPGARVRQARGRELRRRRARADRGRGRLPGRDARGRGAPRGGARARRADGGATARRARSAARGGPRAGGPPRGEPAPRARALQRRHALPGGEADPGRGRCARPAGHTAIDRGHTVIDLGDDAFTVGRPHPMIDFRLRNEHIAAAAADPTTAVILLDVVLGYGAHPDPAGALLPAIARARGRSDGRAVAFVASVCGTAGDPQNLARQEAALSAAGVILAPSNAESGPARRAAGGRRGGRVMGEEPARAEGEAGALFPGGIRALNVGVAEFSVAPRAHGAAVLPLDWRPPAGGDRELGLVLARLEDDLDDPVGARVAAANRLAVERLLAARPVLVDVQPAALVVPGLGARTILHAGPPIEWARMCGPMRGAVIGAVLYEGWAATAEAAERLARDGSIGFTPVTITARSGRWRGSSRRRCRWPSSTMRRRATAPSRR